MKYFIKQVDLAPYLSANRGWGNGYVALPKGHWLYGKDYNEIHTLLPNLRVHGGLTFSQFASDLSWPEIPKNCKDHWIIGFDTAHWSDSLSSWPKKEVMIETLNLLKQIIWMP